ncbi:hypothetical protein D5085_16110 [Ectothiorhodospiraceae bacterium BW-2]|nr:hypothetical protein D5085_16110 [Ectothiorhodospiraceae bacterium BW-2]
MTHATWMKKCKRASDMTYAVGASPIGAGIAVKGITAAAKGSAVLSVGTLLLLLPTALSAAVGVSIQDISLRTLRGINNPADNKA